MGNRASGEVQAVDAGKRNRDEGNYAEALGSRKRTEEAALCVTAQKFDKEAAYGILGYKRR
jgi:hypothetical protein